MIEDKRNILKFNLLCTNKYSGWDYFRHDNGIYLQKWIPMPTDWYCELKDIWECDIAERETGEQCKGKISKVSLVGEIDATKCDGNIMTIIRALTEFARHWDVVWEGKIIHNDKEGVFIYDAPNFSKSKYIHSH